MTKKEFLNTCVDCEDKVAELVTSDFKILFHMQDDYTHEIGNHIVNFLNYKFSGKFDCDKEFGKMFNYEHTDTMNSYWTIFKQYIKMCLPNEFELENGAIKKDYIDKYNKQYGFELSSQQLWITHILELIETKNIEFNDQISQFAATTHTIGNFISVPAGFNVGRYSNTLDYWDLTLLCIYKWYQTYSDFWIEILSNNNENAKNNIKEWLLSYNRENESNLTAWQIFITLNHLIPFVDENDKPIELFSNHFNNFEKYITDREKFSNYNEKEKLLNPQNANDLIECVTKINTLIINRSVQIAEYEFEHMDDEETTSDEITYDTLIVTNKTDIKFPISADIMKWDKFYEICNNDTGISVNNKLFFDIDLLDEELYTILKDTGIDISFFRIVPTYVTDEILEWKI